MLQWELDALGWAFIPAPQSRLYSANESWLCPRCQHERARTEKDKPRPMTQADFPLDDEFAQALHVTGANRFEGLMAARHAASTAGFVGENDRAVVIWYARALEGLPLT